jgi:N-carbamoylputrescine amidase
MVNEHARSYGRRGAHVILVPRAVRPHSLGRWLVAARMAAIVSGSYVLSSNRAGTDARGQEFGGSGWIIDLHGDVAAETSPSTPAVFHEIDLGFVHQAQSEYPCYVAE